MKNILSFLVSFTFSIGLFAQPAGTIDLSFADNGKLIIDNGNVDLFTDVEIQNDQKIVAVGITYDAAFVASAQAMRFLPDGSPDLAFGTNGVFTYSLNFEANIYACTIRDNGKIVMTGSTTDYNDYRILLIQLNEDGTLDNSFGTNGVVVQKIGPEMNFFEDHSYAITLQDDGKILVAGKSYNLDFKFVPVVVRFTESGQLDTEFGTNGVACIPVLDVENDFDCLVVQEDGKIVASGHIANELLSFALLVARFMPDGTLDNTFGNNGIVNYPYQADAEGFGITLTSDSKILLTGFTATPTYNFSMLLMKFDQQGNPDPGFGEGGLVVADYGTYDVGYSIHVQSNDKIVVAGTSGDAPPSDCDMAIWRYNPDGTLDDTFGTDGMSKIQFSGNPDEGLAMAHQTDGKFVIAGKARDANFNYAMVRILNDFATEVPEKDAVTSLSVSPNPARQGSVLQINYELPADGKVQVEFVNSLGRKAAVVDLGAQNEGLQSSVFSLPAEMSVGVYFATLRTKEFMCEPFKLILTK